MTAELAPTASNCPPLLGEKAGVRANFNRSHPLDPFPIDAAHTPTPAAQDPPAPAAGGARLPAWPTVVERASPDKAAKRRRQKPLSPSPRTRHIRQWRLRKAS